MAFILLVKTKLNLDQIDNLLNKILGEGRLVVFGLEGLKTGAILDAIKRVKVTGGLVKPEF